MNTGESTRPSLVAGSGHTMAAGSGRILADMEQRKPERAPRSHRGRALAGRRLLLGFIVVTVLVLLLLAAMRLWQHAPADPAQTVDDPAIAAQDIPLPVDTGDPPHDVAVIVDDRADDPFRRLGATSPDADATPASAVTTTTATATAPPADAVRAAPPRPPMRRVASTAPAAPADDGGLLSTLMRIIHQDGSATGEAHESMDALVAELRADDERSRQTQARLESLGGPQPQPASRREARTRQQVEQALAACPRANTPAGIACRDRVCAPHAGRLPLCPL
ncbi:hypothetical protein E4582_02420 [Luteimonas yindakuii]|uniref:Uncharacterized protein n=1 Tax=Luteimonas yindakuii TaxID=2565782 RepID=A0A4Z1RAI4_9GAMM|nr:hypothetical protein [Luteimonas yindakuii]TKS53738.1 hypothetical protein E4582_02420 [Luteimonas yindakuii]